MFNKELNYANLIRIMILVNRRVDIIDKNGWSFLHLTILSLLGVVLCLLLLGSLILENVLWDRML